MQVNYGYCSKWRAFFIKTCGDVFCDMMECCDGGMVLLEAMLVFNVWEMRCDCVKDNFFQCFGYWTEK